MRAGFSSHRDQWGVLIHHYVKNDVNTLKTNQKMPVGKRDNYFLCFFKDMNRRKRPTEYDPQKLFWESLFKSRLWKH